jgi:hypothetical protein
VSDYSELNLFRRATTEYNAENNSDGCLSLSVIFDTITSLPFRSLLNAASNKSNHYGQRFALVTILYQTVIFGQSIHCSDPRANL